MYVPGREFKDRRHAGRELAQAIALANPVDPIVLALPRGGVPVAFEVAKALQAPLDLLIVRKIGAPGHEEVGIGAVVDGNDPQMVLNEQAMASFAPSAAYVEQQRLHELEEIARRRAVYLRGRPALSVKGRNVILVDDGIATGGTVRAALLHLKSSAAAHVTLAVPVAPQDALDSLASAADDIVCLSAPEHFHAVGLHYQTFGQTSDAEVVELLDEARSWSESSASSEDSLSS
jgi:putative phosphoribosyl transferase